MSKIKLKIGKKDFATLVIDRNIFSHKGIVRMNGQEEYFEYIYPKYKRFLNKYFNTSFLPILREVKAVDLGYTLAVVKKTPAWKGIVLLIAALFLYYIFLLPLIVFSFWWALFKGQLGNYFKDVATSLDITGGVAGQYLLNVAMVKKGGYKFGDIKETMSSCLGKNEVLDTVKRPIGTKTIKVLDIIDRGHANKSITYITDRKNEIKSQEVLDFIKKELSLQYLNVDFSGVKLKDI